MTCSDDAQHRQYICSADTTARLLVNAGPGTGKTEMASLRMAGLIRSGLSPGQLLVLSFSRSAVRNLTHRLLARLDDTDAEAMLEDLRHVSIRTFDSWAFRILRLLGHPASTLLTRGHDENIKALTSLINGPRRAEVRTRIGDRQHLIVDEFQDLPGVRGELVLALLDLLSPPSQPGAGFTILGDKAQAIYGFAAMLAEQTYRSPAEYWDRIRNTYGSDLEERSLTRNYRSNERLAELSSRLRNVLLSERTEDEKFEYVRKAVASLPSVDGCIGPAWLDDDNSRSRAILTRSNGECLRVLQDLYGRDVEGRATPVLLRAGNYASLPPAWVGALLGRFRSPELRKSQYIRLYDNLTMGLDDEICQSLGLPSKTTAWSRLSRASGASKDATNLRIPKLRDRLHWPDAFPDDQLAGGDGLVVTTIHQSKGLEFDVVTVLDSPRNNPEQDNDDTTLNDSSVLEEANVQYVGITRGRSEVNVLDKNSMYRPPTTWNFRSNRERLCRWWNNWVNLEIGQQGDIDPFGFVDHDLHGGIDAVENLQNFLLKNARTLQGHKVMLCKHINDGEAEWHIHLQDDKSPGLVIGRTSPQLKYDLLHILHGRGYVLPSRIWNLRIASVGTVSSDAEFSLEEPYRISRLWLGVSLFGTGDFKSYRRH